MLWEILLQFIFRLSLGIAVAMAVTPSKDVTSGFFRVHLWVILGLCTFATLIAFSLGNPLLSTKSAATAAIASAVCSYIGSVVWIYEKRVTGLVFLLLVAATTFWGCLVALPVEQQTDVMQWRVAIVDSVSAAVLIGMTITAMFLGHWYLNTPTMKLGPLRALILFMASAAVARLLFCGGGLAATLIYSEPMNTSFAALLVLRWASGLIGLLVLSGMTWQTLKIPNTQSATGILYAGVILAFIGELTSQLLSVDTLYPV